MVPAQEQLGLEPRPLVQAYYWQNMTRSIVCAAVGRPGGAPRPRAALRRSLRTPGVVILAAAACEVSAGGVQEQAAAATPRHQHLQALVELAGPPAHPLRRFQALHLSPNSAAEDSPRVSWGRAAGRPASPTGRCRQPSRRLHMRPRGACLKVALAYTNASASASTAAGTSGGDGGLDAARKRLLDSQRQRRSRSGARRCRSCGSRRSFGSSAA